MTTQAIEAITRRRRSAALAAAVTAVHTADLPDDYDAVIARFSTAADQFIESMERGLPVLRQALEKELSELHRSIKIAGASEPPSFSINSGFRLPDDEPPAQPLPDSRFSLPTDESPLIPDNKPGPFTPPEGD